MPRKAAATVPMNRLIPRSRVKVDWLPTGDRLELLIPRYSDPLVRRVLQRLARPERLWVRYRLDPRASRIYSLIDGYRTVADLVDIYRETYPEDCAQVSGRVMGLLRSLEAQGFVTFKQI
ncbi:MAG: PqqD family protein [Candidatus Krumholzibacteriia bacterium]